MIPWKDGPTPSAQAALRASVRKERKNTRGRRPAKSPKKSKPKRKGSKKLGGKSKPKSSRSRKSKPKTSHDEVATKKVAKPKTGTPDPENDPPSTGSEGGMRPLGCSRCRYAAKGCKTCKNPNFKPRARRSSSWACSLNPIFGSCAKSERLSSIPTYDHYLYRPIPWSTI